jgi:methylated-DNA-[protein]-cysteine S-methyltransferase
MIAYDTQDLAPLGPVTVAAGSSGVCLVWLGSTEQARSALQRRYPGEELISNPGPCAEAFRQLREYLDGRREEFTLPLHLAGTPFQQKVWEALTAIPYGETRTYGQIARAVGYPEASRAVGAANGANPLCIIVPCHRVIGAGGKLTGYACGLDVKRRLLALEGVLPPELPLAQPPAERYLKIKANGSRPAAGKGTVWQEGVSTIRNAHPPPARKARRP